MSRKKQKTKVVPISHGGVSETYDDKHHKFNALKGHLDKCSQCGQGEHAEVHLSFEQFSMDVDQTFGR